MTDSSNAEAIIDFAKTNLETQVEELPDREDVFQVDVPAGRTLHFVDLECLRDAPRRQRGTTTLATPDALIRWTQRNAPDASPERLFVPGSLEVVDTDALPEPGDEEPLPDIDVRVYESKTFDLYANPNGFNLTTVLNPSRNGDPGWADWRGALSLKYHPNYQRWRQLHGQLVDQGPFAQHIQMCSGDIAEPPAADLLEMAETLVLNVDSKISSAERTRDGARHFVFTENVEARSGAELEAEVPQTLTIRVPPIFEGTGAEEVVIRLNYRNVGGSVAFLLQIIDLEDRERLRFDEIALAVGDALGVQPISGSTPAIEGTAPPQLNR